MACSLVLLVALPLGLGNFWIRVGTTALMFAVLAQAMQIMVGLAGWPALGNVVFFGVGAYAAAVAYLRLDVHVLIALGVGSLVAALVALAAARAMLSLRGSYFLMATVALNFAALELVQAAQPITNGSRGLTLGSVVAGTPQFVYLVFYGAFGALLVGSSLMIYGLRRSRVGIGLLALRGNEEAALMVGVPAFRYRAMAWCASAWLTGLAGGVYAFWIGYIDPESVFDLLISLSAIVMVLLGGRQLIAGPVVGALVFEFLDVIAWRQFNEARLAVLGIALVLLVRFLPGGLPQLLDTVRGARPRSTRSDRGTDVA